MIDEDVRKLAEFIGKATAEIKGLNEQVHALNTKVDTLIKDVITLETTVENHPINCPINNIEIRRIINEQIKLTDAERPAKTRHLVLDVVSIVSIILSIVIAIKVFVK
jgi:hypothetical protein